MTKKRGTTTPPSYFQYSIFPRVGAAIRRAAVVRRCIVSVEYLDAQLVLRFAESEIFRETRLVGRRGREYRQVFLRCPRAGALGLQKPQYVRFARNHPPSPRPQRFGVVRFARIFLLKICRARTARRSNKTVTAQKRCKAYGASAAPKTLFLTGRRNRPMLDDWPSP